MRIVWTPHAIHQVRQIGAYLEERDGHAAERVLRAILASVERLSAHPLSGRLGRVAGTREIVVPRTPYLVTYRPQEDRIEILAVIHAARIWPKGFKSSP